MTFFIFFFLSLSTSDNDCSKLKVQDFAHLEKEIDSLIATSKIRCLTVELKTNKNSWIVYGNDLVGRDAASYDLKDTLKYLPSNICQLNTLVELDISMLGLKELPFCIQEMSNLRVLDISFNDLEFDQLAEIISKLEDLNVLKIYGINLTQSNLKFLKRNNTDLQIFNARDDFIKEQKKER